MSKEANISARCDPKDRERYHRLAARYGYTNFSEFLLVLLDGVAGNFGDHESRLLHVSDDRIVASGPMPAGASSGPTSAFPVIAPARFWRHIDRNTDSGPQES